MVRDFHDLLTLRSAVEPELILTGSGTRVSRLVGAKHILCPELPCLKLRHRGSISNLTIEDQEPLPVLLSDNKLLIRIYAVGLNFRDVLNVLGQYPGDPGPPAAAQGRQRGDGEAGSSLNEAPRSRKRGV